MNVHQLLEAFEALQGERPAMKARQEIGELKDRHQHLVVTPLQRARRAFESAIYLADELDAQAISVLEVQDVLGGAIALAELGGRDAVVRSHEGFEDQSSASRDSAAPKSKKTN